MSNIEIFTDKKEGVTTFQIGIGDMNKWIHQNNAEYTGDFVDGVLADSFMLSCKRGTAAVYEHYLNSWSSDYIVLFVPYSDEKRTNQLYDDFYKYVENCEKEAAEYETHAAM